MERRNLDDKLKEFTTRKLREEWAEHEELFQLDVGDVIKVGFLFLFCLNFKLLKHVNVVSMFSVILFVEYHFTLLRIKLTKH